MVDANIYFKGELKGHGGWVTSIATPSDNKDIIVSASRDKTIMVWKIVNEPDNYGYALKSYKGHGHIVSDVALSRDSQYALTSSWDKSLRLWNLAKGESSLFVGHQKDVLAVAFSADNKQIFSVGRDKSIKIWNTIGKCMYTFDSSDAASHKEWVSCIKFSANSLAPEEGPLFITASWDKTVKIWGLKDFKLKATLVGHTAPINTLAIAPDGSLCASGGKDGLCMLWDLSKKEQLHCLNAGETINALAFSPDRFWLCAATASSIKIWDLMKKTIVAELVPFKQEKSEGKKAKVLPSCISLAWSSDGTTIYSGYTDNVIRVWGVENL